MNWKTTLTAAGLASAMIAAPALAETVKWDMANEYQATSIHGQAQAVFAETARDASGGSIDITSHFGGSIGYKSKEHFDAVADGALPIANTSMGQVAGIEPMFLLSSLPFLVGSASEAQTLWDVAKPYYEEVFARNNQILLYASPWPPAGIWAKKAIVSGDSLAGVKVRAWDASGTSTLQTAGAAAIQMSWADVVPQLASGGIDGVLTSAEGGTNAKFWEHLTHFSAINYSMSLNMTHVNKDAHDALSDDQRAALSTAAQAASDAAWGALATRVAENFAEMEANGITVIKDVPSEFLGLLSTSGASVYSDWLKKVGTDGEAILAAYRAQR